MKRFLLLCALCALACVPSASAQQQCSNAGGCVTANPSHVNFGAVPLGGQTTRTVTLTNETSATVEIVGVHLVQPHDVGFNGTTSCPVALGPGDSCTAEVSMTGLVKGHHKGLIDIRTTCTADSWLTHPDVCSTLNDVVPTLSGTTRPARAG